MRIRFAGFGGPGVILCGLVYGKAAMLDGKNAAQTQSYGSASRGGLTRSDVCIERGEIHDLVADELDVLVAMSQQSLDAYRGCLLPEGVLFYESDLVELAPDDAAPAHGIQASDIAFKQFGRKIMANMVMMGFVNAIVRVVSRDALERVIRESVPTGTEEKNIAALEVGLRLGAAELAARC